MKAAVLLRWKGPGVATPSARRTAIVSSLPSRLSVPAGKRSAGAYTSIMGIVKHPVCTTLDIYTNRRMPPPAPPLEETTLLSAPRAQMISFSCLSPEIAIIHKGIVSLARDVVVCQTHRDRHDIWVVRLWHELASFELTHLACFLHAQSFWSGVVVQTVRRLASLSYQSKMTSKGQVTIPKDLRDRFGLKEGEEVLMVPANEGILLKHRMDSMRSLRGLLREEVDLKKASTFIGKVRREWRVEGE